MRYCLTLASAYLTVAALTTAVWAVHARTETNRYACIVTTADGTNIAPFV
jgi:hypothetical protein